MNAEGLHSGFSAVILSFKAAIHGVRSASAHLEVSMNATGMPIVPLIEYDKSVKRELRERDNKNSVTDDGNSVTKNTCDVTDNTLTVKRH
jgi:hypothetical protein